MLFTTTLKTATLPGMAILSSLTADCSLRDDGGVRVINRESLLWVAAAPARLSHAARSR